MKFLRRYRMSSLHSFLLNAFFVALALFNKNIFALAAFAYFLIMALYSLLEYLTIKR